MYYNSRKYVIDFILLGSYFISIGKRCNLKFITQHNDTHTHTHTHTIIYSFVYLSI